MELFYISKYKLLVNKNLTNPLHISIPA